MDMSCRSNFMFRNMTELASGQVTFGVIPSDHWYQPEWIDEERATEGRNRLVEADVIYGGELIFLLLTSILIDEHIPL